MLKFDMVKFKFYGNKYFIVLNKCDKGLNKLFMENNFFILLNYFNKDLKQILSIIFNFSNMTGICNVKFMIMFL